MDEILEPNSAYLVRADYEVIDPRPLILPEKVQVEVIRKDDNWPGGVWIKDEKQAGWIPETHLDSSDQPSAMTVMPFNGTELSAHKGELLHAVGSAPGWIFARNERQETGWFPLFNLRPVQQT